MRLGRLARLWSAGQTEWLQPPWGENQFFTPAMDAELKIAGYFRPWRWNGHNSPPPFAEALRLKLWPGDVTYAGVTAGASLTLHLDNPYAAIINSREGLVPCRAVALGGEIDVTRDSLEPGQLVVQENTLTGWSVRLDGNPATLAQSVWLTTPAPAGQHTYRFRYRP
jgi:hypothetical protein